MWCFVEKAGVPRFVLSIYGSVCTLLVENFRVSNIAMSTIIHVSPTGNDANVGSYEQPLRTVQAAADRATPGDVVEVHAGTYREWISPRHGGTSELQRITFRAASGEDVILSGAEVVMTGSKVEMAYGALNCQTVYSLRRMQ